MQRRVLSNIRISIDLRLNMNSNRNTNPTHQYSYSYDAIEMPLGCRCESIGMPPGCRIGVVSNIHANTDMSISINTNSSPKINIIYKMPSG